MTLTPLPDPNDPHGWFSRLLTLLREVVLHDRWAPSLRVLLLAAAAVAASYLLLRG